MSSRPSGRLASAAGLLWVSLCIFHCGWATTAVAQSQQLAFERAPEAGTASAPRASSDGEPQSAEPSSGSISGTVVDPTGAVAVGAHVRLARGEQTPKQEAVTGPNGQFSLTNLAPGPFQLTIEAPGFATQVISGVLHPGEAYLVPQIVLAVESPVTEVRVGLTPVEVAQVQVKEEEKQRVFGFIPNFYVSYLADAAPLVPRQKFGLAWKSVTDPLTFVGAGFLAGIDQAADVYGGYGQGAEGYARRFGAEYGDIFIGTFIDSAVLPSLLKQDPRYFYQGTGTTRSRLLHALANAVTCRGDNKQLQPNYSAIIGAFATAGISYTYIPPNDRSAGLLVQTALVRIASGSVAGIFQEFVLRKFTSHVPHNAGQP